jgi:hypothetical protein
MPPESVPVLESLPGWTVESVPPLSFEPVPESRPPPESFPEVAS